MEASASPVPVRAEVMTPVDAASTVHVHVEVMDTSFGDPEQ
jgi:hypothetical protein